MPLFLSDEEFSQCSGDAALVAEKADSFIRGLYKELDTVRGQADAAAITAEQTCSLLEQKFLSLSEEFSALESRNAQLQSSLDQHASDLAQIQSHKHQLHLQSIGKDGEVERLTTEVSELHKSKRQLMELVENKDSEISEKNATIKSYLDKIVSLTENAAKKEARLSEIGAELARSQASSTRLLQEKELIERHNVWLNEELTSKVNVLIELRSTHANLEADMSTKLAEVERQFSESSNSLKWNKEKVKELETKLISMQEELSSSKDVSAANEERLSAELLTVNKLAELYKESSEEWSRKARELEGVVKALETHLFQVENDHKENFEKEVCARKHIEKEAADLKQQLEKCEAELESSRKANELSLAPLSSITGEIWRSSFQSNDVGEDNRITAPKIPDGVSGTALAASLLRDGWSLTKMYAKYQEAIDAFRHEQLGKKESEAILQRVLYELEQKAEIILDERVEHERMIEAYSVIEQKLQQSVSEHADLEKTIQALKTDLKRQERDYTLAHKEIDDLQRQVTILLKECRDIQLRCGSVGGAYDDHNKLIATVEMNVKSDAEEVISERLLTFKDISGLVEQNVQLRSLVRNLSEQIEEREIELKEKFEIELKTQTDEAASKVSAVLQRAEEQGRMLESLHTSVAMYKRLYEEEHKLNSSYPHSSETAPAVSEDGRMDFRLLLESSQAATKKLQEQATERVRCLEEDLAKSRSEITAIRAERDKLSLEATFARDRLHSFMKEFEHQRNEVNGVLARNVEFSKLVIEYQRKLRESSESLQAAEELSRKLTMEVTVHKHEKEMLSNAEKRACEEVRSLSERVHRLQASLDTIQSTEEVREEARVVERRKQDEYVKRIEREWAEAKKELQEERDNARNLTLDREETLKNAMRQVEEMGNELSKALQAVAAAETRAGVAEARLSDLEKFKSADLKVVEVDSGTESSPFSTNEVVEKLQAAKKEVEKWREEAQANKYHMLQYKDIAQVNEAALKQIESAHENFKIEADKLKKSLEAELLSLRERVTQLEHECSMKSEEVISAASGKNEALTSALDEITTLKQENDVKISKMEAMELQISALKDDLQKEHERWRSSQANYERQVIQQSETIQELTKISQASASLQQEASKLRKLADTLKAENDELKAKWNIEKTMLEDLKNAAEKKCTEINEQNKILHSRLEALHIQLAEKDHSSSRVSSPSTSADGPSDSGLQNVINYLRRSKEIAETEISLLKQEKLRLQTQLESALKATETAQTLLNAERSNSRTMLFTEEEIKSLQFQVREINLLHESNMQLREENKHNFEECLKLREVAQKARAEYENLEILLRERQREVDASKKEIEIQRMEKNNLEQRVSEVLARCGNVSAEDYDHMKEDVRLLQEKLKENDIQIEELKKVVSGKQGAISQLELDVTNCRLELSEREKRINNILQVEANLKSDMEKQRKMVVGFKRRCESLSKEKEEMRRENQALAKQLEEAKQGKRSMGDIAGEQVIKDREEKDTKTQILEKHLERQREELRKEKEDSRMEKARRLKSEKAIKNSFNNVEQEKTKYVNELEKHRQAIKQLSEDLEKLKHAEANLPEGTSVLQLLAGTALDDLAASYVLAVENFEKTANLVSSGLGAPAVSADTSVSADIVPPQGPRSASSAAPTQLTQVTPTSPLRGKTIQDNEKGPILPKTGRETRKIGRRLVRPRLVKPEQPQGDIQMSETDGSTNSVKPAPSLDSQTQGNLISETQDQPVTRKRPASTSEVQGDLNTQVESSMGVAAPVQKKSKSLNTSQDGAEGQSTTPLGNAATLQAREESSDVGPNDDVIEPKEAEETTEKAEEPKEPHILDHTNQEELRTDRTNVLDENLDNTPNETEMVNDVLIDHAEQENQQMESESEKEEGEMISDAADLEANEDMFIRAILMDSPEETPTTPVASPTRVDEEAMVPATAEFDEPNSPEALNDEKNEDAYVTEETAKGSDKPNDGNDKVPVETEQVSDTAPITDKSTSTVPADASVPKQASSGGPAEAEEAKPVSPANAGSTIVNLSERARQRAMLRQAGATPPLLPRGRGRAVPRGRAVRGRAGQRSGRGQAPPEQGHGS